MEINIELDELLKDGRKDKFKELFDAKTDSELSEAFQKITNSALHEYTQMFLGRGISSRADEIQQDRLFYLIENYFGEIPSEDKVSSMFKLTQTKSRNLIRSVTTRFHYDLEEIINKSLKKIVSKAELDDEEKKYYLKINSTSNLEKLNTIIRKRDSGLDYITKVKNSGIYSISKSSCKELCKHFVVDYDSLKDNKRE